MEALDTTSAEAPLSILRQTLDRQFLSSDAGDSEQMLDSTRIPTTSSSTVSTTHSSGPQEEHDATVLKDPHDELVHRPREVEEYRVLKHPHLALNLVKHRIYSRSVLEKRCKGSLQLLATLEIFLRDKNVFQPVSSKIHCSGNCMKYSSTAELPPEL